MKLKLKQSFLYILLLFLTYILFCVLFYNNVNIIKVDFFGVILGLIINYGFIFLFYRFLISKIKNEKISLILMGSLLFVVQVLFSYVFVVTPTWDFGTIFDAVNKSITNAKGLFSWPYFYRYENNIALAVFFRILFGICDNFGINNFLWIGILLNIVFIDISILYIYKILKMLFDKKQSLKFLIFILILTPFITYCPIFYTDTLTLPFVSGALYYFFNYIWCDKKIKNLIFCGLFIGLGSCFKITVIFILIAIIIFEIFNENNPFFLKKIKSLMIVSIACLLPLLLLNSGKNYKLDSQKVNNIKFPITHWIMMGLNDKNYGGYLRSDVDYTVSFPDVESKKKANILKITRRIKEYTQNGSLLKFYTNKLVKVWGDGSFYAPNKLSRQPQKNYNLKKHIIGDKNQTYIFNCIAQSQLILMLFFIIFAIIVRKKLDSKKEECMFFCSILIFGLILFFIIWESRSRYLVNYIPVLLLNMFIGIDYCYKLLKKKVSER